MLVAERHSRIVRAVRGARIVRSEDLVAELGVSAETVRRDLATLEKGGLIARVHGGATATLPHFSGVEAPFSERTDASMEFKQRIGIAAARLVKPRQTLVLDIGTTAVQVARALPHDFRGTVATCSLLVAAELANRPDIEIYVSGGHLRSGDLALSGGVAQEFFRDFNPDIAFLGSGGIDATSGLTDFYLEEIMARRIMIENSVRSYVLVDSTKFGLTARHKVTDFAALSGVITDSRPSTDLEQAIVTAGGELIIN